MLTTKKCICVFMTLLLTSQLQASAQTIGRLMELEQKVAEKELMDKLEKSNAPIGLMPGQGGAVPPISLVGQGVKSPVGSIDAPRPAPVKRTPTAINIFGVGTDLKADVMIGGVQYQAVKGGMVERYLVTDIRPSGVVLEETVTVRKKGKKVPTQKVVFAPLV